MPAPLVPIPWQPKMFLTPDTLALLVAAGEKRGRTLHVRQPDGAWRSYAVQKYYYDGWVKRLPGFNPASNPDIGLRQHPRGAAFDLIDTDAQTQAACRAVGLVRDGDEAWHWNNPRWARMPIITANTGTAGSVGTPIDTTPKEDEEMRILQNEGGNQYLLTDQLPASGHLRLLSGPDSEAFTDAGVVIYPTALTNIQKIEAVMASAAPARLSAVDIAAAVWEHVTGHAKAGLILAATANEGESVIRNDKVLAALKVGGVDVNALADAIAKKLPVGAKASTAQEVADAVIATMKLPGN